MMDALNDKYNINIYERYLDLKNSNKLELDNNDLWKIFEYYSCLKLSEEFKKPFYEYDDIDPNQVFMAISFALQQYPLYVRQINSYLIKLEEEND
jgi:hypothetical protein